MDIKNLAVYISIGTFAVSMVAGGAIAQKNITDSKEKISKLETAQQEYVVKQAELKKDIEQLDKSVDSLSGELKEMTKELIKAIRESK